jgi:segregation and condensation protein B
MQLKSIIEGALLAAGRPLTLDELADLFDLTDRPSTGDLAQALQELCADCEGRGFEVQEVASGYRLQVRQELSPWIARLWEEKPARYSRAMLETLAIIAYRQPITRGDIEEVRGVAVNPSIIRTLQERDWVRIVGHRDVPGRPELLATTRQFLDYFGLKGLDDLPSLAEIKDFEQVNPEMKLAIEPPAETGDTEAATAGDADQQGVEDELDAEAPQHDGLAEPDFDRPAPAQADDDAEQSAVADTGEVPRQ